MPLKLMYITNNLEIALAAQESGVDRIWVDLEVLGKDERQKGLDTVKSKHTIDDIKKIKPFLTTSEMLVRINPLHAGTLDEVDRVIEAGADIIMLPMWRSVTEVNEFLSLVNGRCRTSLLLETKDAVDCINNILEVGGFDEIHIGLNDLHLDYGLDFMFELLSNGIVESLCNKFNKEGIPYGFGGIAKLGCGILPAENIIMEHYRLRSSRVILSRSFYNSMTNIDRTSIDSLFGEEIRKLRQFEEGLSEVSEYDFFRNKNTVKNKINQIINRK